MTEPFNADTALDPVSALLKWLWTQLDSTTYLADVVKPGNRIKFDDKDGVKVTSGPADYPQLQVTVPSMNIYGINSSEDACDIVLRLTVYTDTWQFYNRLPTLLWDLNRFVGAINKLSPNLGNQVNFEKFGQSQASLGYTTSEGKSRAGQAANVDLAARFTFSREAYYV